MIVFLRVVGAAIQAAISLFIYDTFRKYYTEFGAIIAAFFFFNTLPKWIQTPEFANMTVWFGVLVMLCLLRAYHEDKYRTLWFVLAGLTLALLVLSYPSCVLAMIPLAFVIRMLSGKKVLKDASVVIGTCAGTGICYVAYFLSHMTLEQFLFGLRQMMTDGYHEQTLLERALVYGEQIFSLVPHVFLIMGFAAVLTGIYRRFGEKAQTSPAWFVFLCNALAICLIEQVILWLFVNRYMHYPLLYFYLLLFLGIVAYKKLNCRKGSPEHTLLWAGCVWGMAVWFFALVITNTTISVTGSYLMPGALAGIVYLAMAMERYGEDLHAKFSQRVLPVGVLLGTLAVTFLAKGYLVCTNVGELEDIFLVRQKALSGVAKNIYFQYMQGYAYNLYAETISPYVEETDALLILMEEPIYYIMDDAIISTYSTISTPTFDKRLNEYWELYPERYPDYVVCNSTYNPEGEEKEWVESLGLKEPIYENERFRLYQVK